MILILGGTAEGRRLAAALGSGAVLSLAGRTEDPLTVGDTRRGGFGVVVTKDSGGAATDAKLTVAEEHGAEVIMLRRPKLPAADEVASVEDALAWVSHRPTPS